MADGWTKIRDEFGRVCILNSDENKLSVCYIILSKHLKIEFPTHRSVRMLVGYYYSVKNAYHRWRIVKHLSKHMWLQYIRLHLQVCFIHANNYRFEENTISRYIVLYMLHFLNQYKISREGKTIRRLVCFLCREKRDAIISLDC